MVQIKNVSKVPVTVHPSIIPDIMLKEPIVKAIKLKSTVGIVALFGITALGALGTRLAKIDAQLMANNTSIQVYDNTKLMLGVTIFSAAATALYYWSYCTIEADLDQNLLHAPMVLQPGEGVCKYFWPHPVAGIQLNLDAVAVEQ